MMNENIPSLVEYKSADPGGSTKPKQQELKTIHTETHHKLSAVN